MNQRPLFNGVGRSVSERGTQVVSKSNVDPVRVISYPAGRLIRQREGLPLMHRRHQNPMLLLFVFFVGLTGPAVIADEVVLAASIDSSRTTVTDYQIRLTGEVIVPGPDGSQKFPLTSNGRFQFLQRQLPSEPVGPASLRAIRQYSSAETTTKVGDHVTEVGLPAAYRRIHVMGSSEGLVLYSPGFAIPRKQLELLQMPFDSLATGSVLPPGRVEPGAKWNSDAWLMPVLTGIEAVVEQSATCTLKSLTDQVAIVAFTGKISGAVQGSASNVSFSGEMTLDRQRRLVTSFVGQQKEKRIPGPVSPGLNVTANIRWTQSVTDDSSLQTAVETPSPSEESLQLLLQTQLKLQLHHSREWYLFHETPSVLMMRQLRDGHLISQCNISSAVTVPPKQHTLNKEFLADVTASVQERKGTVVGEDTVRDDARWRMRRIRAVGDASGEVILWDYYLCSATTGEQYSLVFSYSKADSELFGEEAGRILSTLQIAGASPALPRR